MTEPTPQTGSTRRLPFILHPRVLWDLINKQAGTLSKATLEGAMNCFDANATRCDIRLNASRLVIDDNGNGFQDEEDLIRVFRTFGEPHEEGDAPFGRFRMGRGQMFRYGKNLWSSHTFRMMVDVRPQMDPVTNKTAEIGFDLQVDADYHKGCRVEIDLYDPLAPSELEQTMREIREFLAWMPIPIRLNGKLISRDPVDAKWQITTDDAYINLRERGTLDIYNQGALVLRLPSHRFGTGGTIVTKTAIDLNTARNDILSTCPVWKRIAKHLRQTTTERSTRKPRMNDAERQNLVNQLLAGDVTIESMWGVNLITTVDGDQVPLSKLVSASGSYNKRMMASEPGRRIPGILQERKLAFVLSEATLDRFDVEDTAEFLRKLKDLADAEAATEMAAASRKWCVARSLSQSLEQFKPVTLDDFSGVINDHSVPMAEAELSKEERIYLTAARTAVEKLTKEMHTVVRRRANFGAKPIHSRTVHPAVSETLKHWTDGTQRIWIERSQLKKAVGGIGGASSLVAGLLHELCHSIPTLADHVHDDEFNTLFHDAVSTGVLGMAVAEALKTVAAGYRKAGLSIPAGHLHAMDADMRGGGGVDEGDATEEPDEQADAT